MGLDFGGTASPQDMITPATSVTPQVLSIVTADPQITSISKQGEDHPKTYVTKPDTGLDPLAPPFNPLSLEKLMKYTPRS